MFIGFPVGFPIFWFLQCICM